MASSLSAFLRKSLVPAVLVLLVAAGGCSSDSPAAPDPASQAGGQPSAEQPTAEKQPPAPPVDFAPPDSADAVLQNMAKAYKHAHSYADAGEVQVRVTVNGEMQENKAQFSVTFQRPNRLRLHVYKGNLVCDGRELRGWLDVQPNEPFYGKVLALGAPPALTLDGIYSDEVLTAALTQGIAGSSLQLLLLLDEDPLSELKQGAKQASLLEPAAIDERKCHRVALERDDGDLIFWIDQQNYVLRRVQIPTKELQQHLLQQPGVEELKDVAVEIQLAGARLNDNISPAAFQLSVPAGAELVKAFDKRELLPPPPPQLGKPAPDFEVTTLGGKKISKDGLKGRIAVIDFWFTTCPPCRLSLPNLEKIYEKYKDNELVQFVAVSVDEAEVKDDALTGMFDELKVNVPIARDPEQKFAQAMGVPGFPTLVVLGADGVVEDFEVGFNPELVSSLTAKLDRLLAGESIYEDVLKAYQEPKSEPANAPAMASQPNGSQPATEEKLSASEVPQAKIAEKSEPKHLKLTKLWTNQDLQQPGNILVVQEEGQAPTFFVHDGWKQVAQLDAEGKVVALHALEIPDEDVVATLRTAVDEQGKRLFLGFAASQRQVHLFDDQWKTVASYPPDREHAGVADAQLADLDGNGQPELLVSYWGVVGVQGASLQGQRLWANRSLEHVFRMAVTAPDAQSRRKLLCAHSQGTIVPLDHEGTAGEPIAVGTLFLRAVYVADLNDDGVMEYLGLAYSAAGNDTAVSFNLAGEELWSHPLERGLQKHPALEMVTFGRLVGDQKQWVLAGPDGAICVLAADGQVLEQFHYGAAISGLAVAQIEGKPALLVATAGGVDAYLVEPPQ